ncbi:MAG: hypothetical protein K0S75_1362 [Clostridia bacterium]|jgi:hypothetical protein|nr:hypothetical protein [Clostridia bacterium]
MWVVLLILRIILYLLAALLLILITLLVVPFSYRGEASVYGEVSFNYRVGWFWNLINIRGTKGEESLKTEVFLSNKRLFTVKTKVRSEDEPEKDDDKEDKKEKKAAKGVNNLKSMFDTKVIKEGFSYLKKIIKQISPKYLHLQGTYGFDDPSITGMTAGFIYTLQGAWPQSRIQLQPCFTEEILELEFKATGSISVGTIVWDTARFVLKKDIRTKIFKRNKKVKLKSKL